MDTAQILNEQDATKPSKRLTAKFWTDEMESSNKFLSDYLKKGNKVVDRFLDERRDGLGVTDDGEGFRINLFNSNVSTQQDMLYSNLPRVEVDRTHADADDDVARVSAEIMERLLNLDLVDNEATYNAVLRSSLQDRLLPGMGCARVRYEFDVESVEVAAVVDPFSKEELVAAYAFEQITDERAPVEYYHWQDVRWGWARNFSEVPWIGYRSYLSKDEMTQRFGGAMAKAVTYKKQKLTDSADQDTNPDDNAPWAKAEVWEIWDKATKNVVWYSPGCERLLDKKKDPLGLKAFFPSPEFLMANATTQLYRPVADYHLSQDLYNEIDILSTRIAMLTSAVKAVGVYDASADGIKRMLQEGVENELIPVDDWAMFAEQGGIKGAVDWMPIIDIVNALDKLRQLRDETIALLQQTSGMADVMQGGLKNQYEGVGQTQIKAQYGSARMQALQDSFANFAANLLQLKAEVICKHFQPENIIKYSNMEYGFDPELLEQAVALLKEPDMAHLRIVVRPEQVAMVDYAKLKVERTEFLNAMATFMQSAGPLLQAEPSAMPTLLKMLQWTLSGFKGSSQIEGVLDKAITASEEKAKQAAENPQPSPEEKAAQAKAQAEQAKMQGELQKIEAQLRADMQLRQQDAQMDIQTTMATTQAKLQEIQAAHEANMRETAAKMRADVLLEQIQTQSNIEQNEAAAEVEIGKDTVNQRLDIDKAVADAEIEIQQEADKLRIDIARRSLETDDKLREIAAQARRNPENMDRDTDDDEEEEEDENEEDET